MATNTDTNTNTDTSTDMNTDMNTDMEVEAEVAGETRTGVTLYGATTTGATVRRCKLKPVQPALKAQRLKLTCGKQLPGSAIETQRYDNPLPNFAFKFNLRRYITGGHGSAEAVVVTAGLHTGFRSRWWARRWGLADIARHVIQRI